MVGDGWTESYRGMVQAWECDTMRHFTIAYYFDRLADSTLNFLSGFGLGPAHMRAERRALATVDCRVRFSAELGGGDSLHLEAGVLEADARGARLAHRVIDSATGIVCSTFDHGLRYMDLEARRGVELPEGLRDRLSARPITIEEPLEDWRPMPDDATPLPPGAYDTVKPWELDVLGHMSVAFYVHRFSAATLQTVARAGMSGRYFEEAGAGFSTFEIQTRFLRELRAGDRVRVESGLAHVGRTSMRVASRMVNVETGEVVARFSQFGVHLDMESRRPVPIPEALLGELRRQQLTL